MAQILVIEDNDTMREGVVEILSRLGHTVLSAGGGREGVALFRKNHPEFVITDLKMEDMDGMEVIRKVREFSSEALILIMTAYGTIEVAVEAMKLGAFDFVTKPFPPDLLRAKVSQALDVAQMKRENIFLRRENARQHPQGMTGNSKALSQIREQVSRVAPTDTTVLITGESGTGKELVARAIHSQSQRSERPFVKVDCTALAEGVLESELFGHERGAFTGATHRKPGRFELADQGTLFLDEIGEIPPSVQLKLLRVLQDRSFERVGGTQTLRVDVRIVSATNRDLYAAIQQGRFREDLFYRLHIVPIQIPPLRERRADIPSLIDDFCERLSKKTGRPLSFSSEAMLLLQGYAWPGNVRELENLLERLSVLSAGGEIGPGGLPPEVRKTNNSVDLELPPKEIPLTQALESLERQLILRAFAEAGGVKTRTAQLLGIKTSALYYKMEKYGIIGEPAP